MEIEEEEDDDDETMRDEDVVIQEVEAEQVQGPDDGELEMPAAEDWDTRVLRNHDRYLVPIIDMMIGDPAKSHVYAENKRLFAPNTTFNNVRTFKLNHELLVNLVHRPDSRRRLISAIQQFGKETVDCLVISLRFPGFRPEEYPLHVVRTACLAELMRTFSLCHKLRKVSWMFYGDIDAEITELFATVMSRLRPQIKEVVLFAERRHIPLNMLRSLSCLSNLESLDFDNIDAETLRFSFPRLLHATKLKRLGLGYSGLGTTTPTILSEVEAELVARLLALNKLETFKLSGIGLASVAVCQTFVESVVNSTNIKVLTFKRLHIAAQGMNEFYMQFTRRLPEMKNLESLSLYGGLPPMNDADETLQLLILRGAAQTD
ncbi:hypothetical protein MPSEU_000977500 [Mayamaea pseudoterrestris]|nr:hypothetical protein MPSEU_000977500 [Mayamaea pseudoterrestris]